MYKWEIAVWLTPRAHVGSINECGNEREEILFDTATHEWLIRDGFASHPAMTRHTVPWETSRSDC